jgi:hypothetical protein
MTAVEEIAAAGDAEDAIWPVDMPPPLEDPDAEEELSRLHTLEERILHKYTPSKLAMSSIEAPARAPAAAQAADGVPGGPSVKACPACSGVGKVLLVSCSASPATKSRPTQGTHRDPGCLACRCISRWR